MGKQLAYNAVCNNVGGLKLSLNSPITKYNSTPIFQVVGNCTFNSPSDYLAKYFRKWPTVDC